MSLLTPIGLLGLLGIVALIIIYIIKPNYQNKFISSTYIWKLSLKYKKKKIPISKLRNILLFICQLAILAGTAFILTQPYLNSDEVTEGGDTIIIIDASASMHSSVNEEMRLERAANAALADASKALDNGQKVTVIVASDTASFLVQQASKEQSQLVYDAFDKITNAPDSLYTHGEPDIEGAMKLAEQITSYTNNVSVTLYTDTAYLDVGNVKIHDVKDPSEWNAAILDVRATIVEIYYRIEIDVASYGADSRLTVSCDIFNANDSDTTLEIESTYEYIERLKQNPQIDMHIARNNDNKFFEMAKKIGPPTMSGRWCCYMFKTGALNRKMNEIFNGRVLTFYGVRRSESATRANYNRVEEKTESVKIANQRSSAPILYWTDLEVWLYILANKIDFNIAYRYGYNRVGCYCCPNATISSELMERIYNHKKFYSWTDYIREFGKQCGKEDLDDYVKQGRWKMRNGGLGVKAANSVKLKSSDCTAEENGKIYELQKDITNDLYNLFLPFGYLQEGRKEINEMLILHPTSMIPIISLQPLSKRKIKIVTINAQNPRSLHSRLAYQIVKYNACNQCLKCESLCRFGAITSKPDKYEIDSSKCKRCQAGLNPKYLYGVCLMCRYLRTKKDAQ